MRSERKDKDQTAWMSFLDLQQTYGTCTVAASWSQEAQRSPPRGKGQKWMQAILHWPWALTEARSFLQSLPKPDSHWTRETLVSVWTADFGVWHTLWWQVSAKSWWCKAVAQGFTGREQAQGEGMFPNEKYFFLNEWFVGFRQMAEGFTEKASLWDCGLAWGSLEKSVNPRSSRSLTGLTGLPATYEQEAGASVLEITSLFSIKACWQARGREKLFSSPILFSYMKTILEIFFLDL